LSARERAWRYSKKSLKSSRRSVEYQRNFLVRLRKFEERLKEVA
jgi:hypothetical protein